jgi:hypothetical protein
VQPPPDARGRSSTAADRRGTQNAPGFDSVSRFHTESPVMGLFYMQFHQERHVSVAGLKRQKRLNSIMGQTLMYDSIVRASILTAAKMASRNVEMTKTSEFTHC